MSCCNFAAAQVPVGESRRPSPPREWLGRLGGVGDDEVPDGPDRRETAFLASEPYRPITFVRRLTSPSDRSSRFAGASAGAAGGTDGRRARRVQTFAAQQPRAQPWLAIVVRPATYGPCATPPVVYRDKSNTVHQTRARFTAGVQLGLTLGLVVLARALLIPSSL